MYGLPCFTDRDFSHDFYLFSRRYKDLLVAATRCGRYSLQKAHSLARGPRPTATDLSGRLRNLVFISTYSRPLGVCRGHSLRLLWPGVRFGSLPGKVHTTPVRQQPLYMVHFTMKQIATESVYITCMYMYEMYVGDLCNVCI